MLLIETQTQRQIMTIGIIAQVCMVANYVCRSQRVAFFLANGTCNLHYSGPVRNSAPHRV